MKRIYLLFFLLVAAVSNVSAHRNADLSVTLANPTSSTVLNPGGSFSVDAIVTNLGPDSIKYATDSVLWYMSIQNGLVNLTIGSSSGTTWLRYHKPLKQGDTMHITFNGLTPTGYTGAADSMRTFCVYAYPKGPASDTFKDAVTTNNKGCATFLWKKTPTSVNGVAGRGANNVTVYPNPAQGVANISFEMAAKADVKFKVLDLTGRVVMDVDKGAMMPGTQNLPVDTKNLQNGMYVYQLYVGSELNTGKFSVQN